MFRCFCFAGYGWLGTPSLSDCRLEVFLSLLIICILKMCWKLLPSDFPPPPSAPFPSSRLAMLYNESGAVRRRIMVGVGVGVNKGRRDCHWSFGGRVPP